MNKRSTKKSPAKVADATLAETPGWAIKRDAAREAWIQRFQGYFGDPLKLDEYRRGEITFGELYESAIRHAEDMVNEAGRYAPEADPGEDWPNGYPDPKPECCKASEWGEIQSSAAHEASSPNK